MAASAKASCACRRWSKTSSASARWCGWSSKATNRTKSRPSSPAPPRSTSTSSRANGSSCARATCGCFSTALRLDATRRRRAELQCAVDTRQQREQRRRDDIGVNAHAELRDRVVRAHLDERCRLGIGTLPQRPLFICMDAHRHAERVDGGIERAVAHADQCFLHAVAHDGEAYALRFTLLKQMLLHVGERRAGFEIFLRKKPPDFRTGNLGTRLIRMRLHHAAELHLQTARHLQAVAVFFFIGDTAFALLAVFAYYVFLTAADVGRVDGQIRHVPH